MKINLIPEEKQKKGKVQNLNFGITFMAIALLVVLTGAVVFLFSINLAKKGEIKSLEGKISKLNTELKPLAELEKNVLALETKLKDIKELISSNAKWSKFFPEFERILPKEVKIVALSLDKNKSEFTAKIEGNVIAAARILKVFKNTRVIVVSGKTSRENTKFNLAVGGGAAKDIISGKDGVFSDFITHVISPSDYQVLVALYDSSDKLQGQTKVADFKVDSDLFVSEIKKSEAVGFDEFSVSVEDLFESIDLGSQITEKEFTLNFKLKPGVLW